MLDKAIEEVSRIMLKTVATIDQEASRLKEVATTKRKLVAKVRMKIETIAARCNRAYGRLQMKVWDLGGS